jgi:integrase
MKEDLPYPKRLKRLPVVLSQEEVSRLIDSARNLFHRAMLLTMYAAGLRRSELCRLKVSNIDSLRMMLRIERSKNGVDRDVPLSSKLLETLREYWRWMRPKTYLFPGTQNGWRADKPITPKVIWEAVQQAARRAGIEKHVTPHTLRHASAYYTTFQSSFILKTIALGRAQSVAVYGHDGLLALVPARLAIRDPFDR